MYRVYEDKCFWCGHSIRITLNGNSLNAKMAYSVAVRKWVDHKILCEANYKSIKKCS
jgi:hypothetical protein